MSISSAICIDAFNLSQMAQALASSRDIDAQQDDDNSKLKQEINKAQQGNQDSFEYIMKRHLKFISREIAKFCPRNAIEDVAQEVLIRAYQALPRYKEGGTFCWWLKKITSRACMDYWRSTKRSQKIANTYALERKNDVFVPEETLLCDLDLFMAQLSAEERMVFTMACLEDLPQNEIASLLGLSLVATKVRCFRLRRKFMEWLAS